MPQARGINEDRLDRKPKVPPEKLGNAVVFNVAKDNRATREIGRPLYISAEKVAVESRWGRNRVDREFMN